MAQVSNFLKFSIPEDNDLADITIVAAAFAALDANAETVDASIETLGTNLETIGDVITEDEIEQIFTNEE